MAFHCKVAIYYRFYGILNENLCLEACDKVPPDSVGSITLEKYRVTDDHRSCIITLDCMMETLWLKDWAENWTTQLLL